jgi:hypothetical protein
MAERIQNQSYAALQVVLSDLVIACSAVAS